MIHNLKIIERPIKRIKKNLFTVNLVNYQFMKNNKKLIFNDVMTDFDATSLNHSAMWDENSVYPKIGRVFAFKPHMSDVYVEAIINRLTMMVMKVQC